MDYLISNPTQLLIVISKTGAWVPSYSLLYIVLVIGALLTAGVALSAFSFYDDFYWGDPTFREQLRFHSSNRRTGEAATRKV